MPAEPSGRDEISTAGCLLRSVKLFQGPKAAMNAARMAGNAVARGASWLAEKAVNKVPSPSAPLVSAQGAGALKIHLKTVSP